MLSKIVRYLSHLDGVEVGEVHDSHSHYFKMTDIIVRVSDHFAIKANYPTTLNIVCQGDNFVVTYGNKLLPIKNYSALRQLLRNFAMVSDILAPLAETRRQVRVIEKVVEKKVEVVVEKAIECPVSTPTSNGIVSYVPAQNNSDWLYIGDLSAARKTGAYNNVMNMKKLKSKKKKKK